MGTSMAILTKKSGNIGKAVNSDWGTREGFMQKVYLVSCCKIRKLFK